MKNDEALRRVRFLACRARTLVHRLEAVEYSLERGCVAGASICLVMARAEAGRLAKAVEGEMDKVWEASASGSARELAPDGGVVVGSSPAVDGADGKSAGPTGGPVQPPWARPLPRLLDDRDAGGDEEPVRVEL